MGFYEEMRDLAKTLLSPDKYGENFILQKPGKPVYNPSTKKTDQTFVEYPGVCVMKTYTTEMIGSLSNMINAGDVEFKCVFDDESVIPTEGKDKIIFGGHTYNIIHVYEINPNGKKILIHTLQARRAM